MSADKNKEHAILSVMGIMNSLQQSSRTFVERMTRQESLTQNQILLLFQLQLEGSLNISDIAERFVISHGSASFMCNKLEEEGLVEKLRTQEDRRLVNIVITEQGERRMLRLFEDIEPAKLQRMAEVLTKIHELMGIINK